MKPSRRAFLGGTAALATVTPLRMKEAHNVLDVHTGRTFPTLAALMAAFNYYLVGRHIVVRHGHALRFTAPRDATLVVLNCFFEGADDLAFARRVRSPGPPDWAASDFKWGLV